MPIRSVLYVSPMDDYMGVGAPRSNVSRCRALAEQPGVEVTPFDCREALSGSFWEQRINRRAYLGRRVRETNAALIEAAKKSTPDCVYVDSEIWLYPSTLKALKRHAGSLVYYATDDTMARPMQLWLHRMAARHYDVYLTTNRYNVAEVRDRYGARTLRAAMGYDEQYFRAPAGAVAENGAVVFVGHWEQHTENYIRVLRDAGLPVQVYGAGWSRAADASLRGTKPLPGQDYVATIAGAAIALCSLSRLNRNESTGRSYEIPAIGTMMLAEHTCEHAYLFRDGREAALFRTADELVEKATFYRNATEARKQMAENGKLRCFQMGLGWRRHMEREWRMVDRVLEHGIRAITPDDDEPFWPGFRNGLAFRC